MAGLGAFSYQYRQSPLHRLPALAKLATFFVFSLCLLLLPPPFLTLAFFLLLVLGTLAKLSPLSLIAGIFPLLFILMATALASIVSFNPWAMDLSAISAILPYSARLILAFMAANLYFAIAGSLETMSALNHLQHLCQRPLYALAKRKNLRRLQLFLHNSRPALLLSLALSFLPLVFKEWHMRCLAHRARQGRAHTRFILIPLLLEALILQARNRQRAILVRAAYIDE